ncbi:hypothetical protein SAY86_007178 [Trapa natans]|uniref:DCD domain-containing protein n=1 Tax=Trapa natans TaxID=22666 RepID=A0AAN7LEI5_TRANT|nr:hypothetical protein SAY86_007178 [Trapa natans]
MFVDLGMASFWQFGDDLRGQAKVSDDHEWFMVASKLAEQARMKDERMNNLDLSKGLSEVRAEKFGIQEENKYESHKFKVFGLDSKFVDSSSKMSFGNSFCNVNPMYQNVNPVQNNGLGMTMNKHGSNINMRSKEPQNINNINNNNNIISNNNDSSTTVAEKRFKTLPSAETLPRNEVLGGYIFVCNNDTMQEDLKRQLFGLPPRYRDSVRAITPGLPLFLYNYTTHQLHGIFEASSFGGSNIDPTAWEDKKCKGESRFPAQVRIRVRKLCKALEEDSFRPVLHHYDGPKFRLELSVPETLELLDLCEQAGTPA